MIELLICVVLLIATFCSGRWIERRHFADLAKREKRLSNIIVSDMKNLPPNWKATDPHFVAGQVVIGNDYFRAFCAGWRKFFGGRLGGYERLLKRARREATVRMLEEANRLNANVVWNVRFATTSIGGGNAESKSTVFGVEVYAYGTAMNVSERG